MFDITNIILSNLEENLNLNIDNLNICHLNYNYLIDESTGINIPYSKLPHLVKFNVLKIKEHNFMKKNPIYYTTSVIDMLTRNLTPYIFNNGEQILNNYLRRFVSNNNIQLQLTIKNGKHIINTFVNKYIFQYGRFPDHITDFMNIKFILDEDIYLDINQDICIEIKNINNNSGYYMYNKFDCISDYVRRHNINQSNIDNIAILFNRFHEMQFGYYDNIYFEELKTYIINLLNIKKELHNELLCLYPKGNFIGGLLYHDAFNNFNNLVSNS